MADKTVRYSIEASAALSTLQQLAKEAGKLDSNFGDAAGAVDQLNDEIAKLRAGARLDILKANSLGFKRALEQSSLAAQRLSETLNPVRRQARDLSAAEMAPLTTGWARSCSS